MKYVPIDNLNNAVSMGDRWLRDANDIVIAVI